jgi:hypothetical protein
MMFAPRLAVADKLVDGQVDILRYLPQQNRGKCLCSNGRVLLWNARVGVANLLVGSSLSDLLKAKLDPYRSYFFRLENRDAFH